MDKSKVDFLNLFLMWIECGRLIQIQKFFKVFQTLNISETLALIDMPLFNKMRASF